MSSGVPSLPIGCRAINSARIFSFARMVFLKVALDERCLHCCGSDTVDSQLLGKIDRKLARHCDHSSLASTVCEALLYPDKSRNRTYIHDASMTGEQELHCRTCYEEDRMYVYPHQPREIVLVCVQNIANKAYPSVVDEYVEPVKPCEARGD